MSINQYTEWIKCNELNAIQSQEIIALKERIKRLEDWKQSALEIEREWDANAVATMLGAKLGESHRKVIQREVPLLLERIKRLEEAGNNLLWNFCPEYTSDLTQEQSDALKQWNKAKEAKP